MAKADFTADRLGRRFDVVIGAEVLYLPDSYRSLLKFFLAHIALKKTPRCCFPRTSPARPPGLWPWPTKEFAIAERVIGYKETAPESGEPERKLCQIYRMTPKKIA